MGSSVELSMCGKCLKVVPEAHQCTPVERGGYVCLACSFTGIINEVRDHECSNGILNMKSTKNKYIREILPNVWIDVYDVINAFNVTDGGMQHALKKILATGKRGHKNEREDRKDILASVKRSNEIFERINHG